MLAQEVIRRKRDGLRLTAEELAFMVQGISDGGISEGQVAAFAMAVYFNGLEMDERVALTRAMADSGRIIDWSGLELPGPRVDKHSTGGVGDKVSLILAPLVAACGGAVPMISGRGLGHTGGTLDKLDSIPGYRTAPDIARFREAVVQAGCAIIGQTDDLAPADRRLYAVRDVTATVESIGLITASILSKKLAAGLEALVMDVKTGSGAFAAAIEDSRELAHSIVTVANGAGLPTAALITDMDEVLGTSAGNAVEVAEAVAFLTGQARNLRLDEVVRSLAREMLLLAGLCHDDDEADDRIASALDTGQAAERFGRMVRTLGGPSDFLDAADRHLPTAPVRKPVPVDTPCYVAAMDTRALGLLVIELGGGRRQASDDIDHAVGLTAISGVGQRLQSGEPLAIVHARDEAAWRRAADGLRMAMTLTPDRPSSDRLVVHERIV